MEHDEWMTLEHGLIGKTMNLVDRESRDKARVWSSLWKEKATQMRYRWLQAENSWYSWRKMHGWARTWSRAWKKSARQFRSMFQGVSEEWEAERDRYQDMLKKYKDMEDNWHSACKKLDKERQLHYTSSFALDDARNMIFDTSRKMNEARRWAIDFKEKYEQGAPMTIAGMSTRIAELEERNERLIKEIDDFKKKYEHSCLCVESKDWICGLYKLGIGSRNTRIRELRKALKNIQHSFYDPSCKYCFDRQYDALTALEVDDEQAKD